GSHVNDGVHSLRDLIEGVDVSNVTFDQRDARILQRVLDIGKRAPVEIVENEYSIGGEITQQQVDGGRTHQPASPCHQYICTLDFHRLPFPVNSMVQYPCSYNIPYSSAL